MTDAAHAPAPGSAAPGAPGAPAAPAAPAEETGPTLGQLIARVASRHDLDVDEAEVAFDTIMQGRASVVQIAALLAALRVKGETPAEVAGGVRAMRHAMVPVPIPDAAELVDTCGTGGGALTTFNISTAAALVAAGAGVRIAKHGNRSFTSRCGSADVLTALDVVIELSPEGMAEVFEAAGIVFMFAPLLHPAMRHVGPVRRELGSPTIMNVLGPLTNPASARRQVVGVSHPELLELIAGALHTLGHDRALVVHGEPGLDELSPIGRTDVLELRDGALRRFTLEPAGFGWPPAGPEELAGGDPAHNARTVLDVLHGKRQGAARAAVTLNAGAAIYLAGRAPSLEDGVAEAERALDAGASLDALARLRNASKKVAAGAG